MSRSNPSEQLVSPAKKYFEWDGDKGGFKYFDKEKEKAAKGTGNIPVPYPFRFIVLDQLTTIKGYNDADKCGYYSNEVRDIKKEPITVRAKKDIVMTGLYENVIEKLGNKGAKYCKSVYIGYFDENKKLVIGNLALSGASIGPWIDFCKTNKVDDIGVVVKKHIEVKKGKVVYQSPVFEALEIKPETNQEAIELDKELQMYLSVYLERNKSEEASGTQSTTVVSQTASINPVPAKSNQVAETLEVHDEVFGNGKAMEDDDSLPF